MELAPKVQKLIDESDADQQTKDLMVEFFRSISNETHYVKIIDLFERFPSLFDNFVACFTLKKAYFEKGGSENEWNDILAKEEDALNQLKVQE